MNNKKIYITIAAAICVVILAACTVFLITRKADVKEDAVTRYEWLQMLGEQFGIVEYESGSPYFKDVEPDNPYFAYVQSAVEWEIIDDERNFHGEDAASEEFIALTTMRAIGKYRVQIYLGTDKEPDKKEYLEIAYENNLIDEAEHGQGFDKEECLAVLDAAQRMDTYDLWKDDVIETTYQENVIELKAGSVLGYDKETSEIRVDTSIVEELEVGSIIVFEADGLKNARKIESIDSDGTISSGIPELEEIFESFIISDMVSYSGAELMKFYDMGSRDAYFATPLAARQDTEYEMIPSHALEKGIEYEGITFEVDSNDKGELEVKVTDESEDFSETYKIESNLLKGEEMHFSYGIKNIHANVQAAWNWKDGIQYTNVLLEVENDIEITGLKLEKEKKISLGDVPIPIAGGAASVDLSLYLTFSIEGEISVECEIPVGTNICYEKGKGLRNSKINYSYQTPQINVSVEGGIDLGLETVLQVVKIDIIDIEVEAGLRASAEADIHDTQVCADILVAFPVVTISALGDDELNTEIGQQIKEALKGTISLEWEIITKENAPCKLGFHYEVYNEGGRGFVDECTYGKERSDVAERAEQTDASSEMLSEFAKYEDYSLPIALNVSGPLEDAGDYYTIKGNLWIDYTIDVAEFRKLGNGDTFTIRDKNFVKGEGFQTEEFPSTLYSVYCVEDDSTYYVVDRFSLDFGSWLHKPYYTLSRSIPDYDSTYSSIEPLHEELEGEFRISKGASITSLIETSNMIMTAFDASGLSEEEIRQSEKEMWKSALQSYSYTAEECFTNHILLDDFYNIAEYSTAYGEMNGFMRFFITVDGNGLIDSMIMDSYG